MRNYFIKRPWIVYTILGIVVALLCARVGHWIWYNYLDVTYTPGKVESFSWQMDVKKYDWEPVSHSDWWDEIPNDGYGEWCYEKDRTITLEYEDGTTEDVTFIDDYCNYYIDEWVYSHTIPNSGIDKNPFYPPHPANTTKTKFEEQLGVFTVYFTSDIGTIHFNYDRATWDAFREGMTVMVGISRKGTVPYPPKLPQ